MPPQHARRSMWLAGTSQTKWEVKAPLTPRIAHKHAAMGELSALARLQPRPSSQFLGLCLYAASTFLASCGLVLSKSLSGTGAYPCKIEGVRHMQGAAAV